MLPHYGWMFRALDRLGPRGLAAAQSALRTEQRARGVTFRVGDGEPDRLFPLDLVPRIVTAEDWAGSPPGSTQRVRALEAFLRDVYGERRIVADGVVPARSWTTRPAGAGWASWSRPTRCASRWPASTWSATAPTAGCVLEDNLRVPSGIGYSIMSRRLIRSVDARPGAAGRRGRAGGGARAAARGAALGHRAGRARVRRGRAAVRRPVRLGVLRAPAARRPDGRAAGDPARAAGHRGRRVPGRAPAPGGGCRRSTAGSTSGRCSAATGADLRPIGRAHLATRWPAGKVALLNALGNGVADDKLVYAYVPQMISYYLGEDVLLDNVADLPVRRPGPPRRGAGPARRAGAQAGRRLRRAGHRDRPARRRAPSWPSWPRRSGPTRPAGWRRTWCSCPPTRPSPTGSWSRGRWTCGRSCCSPGVGDQHARRGAARRAEPGGPGRQHDRQLLPRRRGEGHLGAALRIGCRSW